MLNFPEQTADGYKILAKSPIAITPCVNPNLPPGTTHLQTAPNALYTTLTIPTIWHIPGELDEHRLRQAIAELTSWWPVLGSRFVRHPTSEPDLPELAVSARTDVQTCRPGHLELTKASSHRLADPLRDRRVRHGRAALPNARRHPAQS